MPVWDKTELPDGTFSRSDFDRSEQDNEHRRPADKALRSDRRKITAPRSGVTKADTITYRASAHDCKSCPLKTQCCPSTSIRKIARSSMKVHDCRCFLLWVAGCRLAHRSTPDHSIGGLITQDRFTDAFILAHAEGRAGYFVEYRPPLPGWRFAALSVTLASATTPAQSAAELRSFPAFKG